MTGGWGLDARGRACARPAGCRGPAVLRRQLYVWNDALYHHTAIQRGVLQRCSGRDLSRPGGAPTCALSRLSPNGGGLCLSSPAWQARSQRGSRSPPREPARFPRRTRRSWVCEQLCRSGILQDAGRTARVDMALGMCAGGRAVTAVFMRQASRRAGDEREARGGRLASGRSAADRQRINSPAPSLTRLPSPQADGGAVQPPWSLLYLKTGRAYAPAFRVLPTSLCWRGGEAGGHGGGKDRGLLS